MPVKRYTDQMDRIVEIDFPPRSIISLVPSQTELLYYLGLREEVIGITKFCVHPEEWYNEKTKIGGTKNINFEKIELLKPDLIIGNKEENEQEQITSLSKTFPVWMSDIENITQAVECIRRLGEITGKEYRAKDLIQEINIKKEKLDLKIKNVKPKNAVYLIWNEPIMTVSKNTFIHHMMEVAGMKNVFENHTQRYPITSISEIKDKKPDLILLSSEPYPFKEKHIHQFKKYFPDSHILVVDGEMFSWYGSRMLHAFEYFEMLHHEIEKELM